MKAEDDIGMAKLELRYSVNGAAEKGVTVFSGKGGPQPSVTGAHTFFLEELKLQPGDVISYYAKAQDNNTVTGPGASSSDIYFIEIRPFERKYTQNQAAPGAGGAGEGPGSVVAVSRKRLSAPPSS